MTKIIKFLALFLFTIAISSCSSDDGSGTEMTYEEVGTMTINTVSATSVEVSFTDLRPNNELTYQIRKKGVQNFTAVNGSNVSNDSRTSLIDGLEPLEA